jgi:two-component system response regulator FixJ
MSARTVYVVEDEEAIRRSVELMLKVMGYTAEVFEHGAAFLDQIDRLDRGCVLLDIRMPQIDGLEVQRRLNAAGAPHSVVVMSGHGDVAVALPALANGAVAFIEKPFARATLERALTIAFARLEDRAAYESYLAEATSAVAALGQGEQRVLALLATGHGNEAIAAELGLALDAVEIARTRMFEELGIQSLTEALQLAFAGGLVERAP